MERCERRILGTTLAMRQLLEAIARVGPKDVTVLVQGETGTGKELVAASLHAASKRAARPLVHFNCAAIPSELAESELFGHARGAFTGATQARKGFFAQASGSTLLLDEVEDLPAGIQGKLLRALQDGEIQPVGSDQTERVDVRVIACTNKILQEEVRAGRFREDLYYRLAVVELRVPPLRERRQDIPALASAFAGEYAARFGVPGVRLSAGLLEKLAAQRWPGNVRELENTVARLVAFSPGGEIGPGALANGDTALALNGELPPALELREHLEAVERAIIRKMLVATGGNQSEAARRLGLSRSALIDRLKKYSLPA